MKGKIKEYFEKHKKINIILILAFVLIGTLSIVSMGRNNGEEQKNNVINIDKGTDLSEVLEDKSLDNFKGVTANIGIPEDVLYKNLNKFIKDNKIQGIDELSISVDRSGVNLRAKYTLVDFIKIPAEFKLVPRVEDSLVKLAIKDIKIMNLKIKIDKIIEKWITANEDIKDFVTYQSGEIFMDITKVAPLNIKEIKLGEEFIGLGLEIK